MHSIARWLHVWGWSQFLHQSGKRPLHWWDFSTWQHICRAHYTIARPSIRLSVCHMTHGWIIQKWWKLVSCNFRHFAVNSPIPPVLRYKCDTAILSGSPWVGAGNKDGVGKTSYFLATIAKRMKIDPHCQRQNCCALKVLFNDV